MSVDQRSSVSEINVPGSYGCPQCKFVLQKSVLCVSDGNIYANVKEEYELCPNDGNPMRPVTWKEAYEEGCKMQMRLQEQIEKLREDSAHFDTASQPSPEAPKPAYILTPQEAREKLGVNVHDDAVAVHIYGGAQLDNWNKAVAAQPSQVSAEQWLNSEEIMKLRWHWAGPLQKLSPEDQLIRLLEAYRAALAATPPQPPGAEATPAAVEGQPDPEKWLSDNWQLSIMNATKPLFRRVPITEPNSYHTIGTVLLEFAAAYASSSRAKE